MDNLQQALLVYLFGFIARVVYPYLVKRLRAPGKLKFDVRYMIAQVLGAAVGLIPILILPEFLEAIGSAGLPLVFSWGWFATDGGNATAGKQIRERLIK